MRRRILTRGWEKAADLWSLGAGNQWLHSKPCWNVVCLHLVQGMKDRVSRREGWVSTNGSQPPLVGVLIKTFYHQGSTKFDDVLWLSVGVPAVVPFNNQLVRGRILRRVDSSSLSLMVSAHNRLIYKTYNRDWNKHVKTILQYYWCIFYMKQNISQQHNVAIFTD